MQAKDQETPQPPTPNIKDLIQEEPAELVDGAEESEATLQRRAFSSLGGQSAMGGSQFLSTYEMNQGSVDQGTDGSLVLK